MYYANNKNLATSIALHFVFSLYLCCLVNVLPNFLIDACDNVNLKWLAAPFASTLHKQSVRWQIHLWYFRFNRCPKTNAVVHQFPHLAKANALFGFGWLTSPANSIFDIRQADRRRIDRIRDFAVGAFVSHCMETTTLLALFGLSWPKPDEGAECEGDDEGDGDLHKRKEDDVLLRVGGDGGEIGVEGAGEVTI